MGLTFTPCLADYCLSCCHTDCLAIQLMILLVHCLFRVFNCLL